MILQAIKTAVEAAAKGPAMAGIYVKCINVSALYRHMQHAWVTIVWSMPDMSAAIPAPGLSLPGVTATVVSAPTDTVMAVPVEQATPADIEEALLQLAWQWGAWDMCRLERSPLATGQSWQQVNTGLSVAFGRNPIAIMGHPLQAGDEAADWMLDEAAANGWVAWRFIPLALARPSLRGMWGTKDSTLREDCTREGSHRLHVAAFRRPKDPNTGAEMQYRLGRKARKER